MKEASKVIYIDTGLEVYKRICVIFFGSKYILKVGGFIILKHFILCDFGFVLYKDHDFKDMLNNCFSNRKEPYKWVASLLTDNKINELVKLHYLNIGMDKNLYIDSNCSIPYRNILNIKTVKK